MSGWHVLSLASSMAYVSFFSVALVLTTIVLALMLLVPIYAVLFYWLGASMQELRFFTLAFWVLVASVPAFMIAHSGIIRIREAKRNEG